MVRICLRSSSSYGLVLMMRNGREGRWGYRGASGSVYPDSADASVGSHDDQWREIRLERAVEEREAFNVEHVYFVNEQHTRHDLGLAFFPPFAHLGVDLITQLGLDLTRVTRDNARKLVYAS